MNDQDYQTIAIIGQTGRFPGADDVATFWQKILAGEFGIQQVDKAELLARGVPSEVLENPDFVSLDTHLADIDMFDAALFGINAREARAMDPQHRMLLEATLNLFRDAAVNQDKFNGDIGLFAGVAFSQYYLHNIAKNPAVEEELGDNYTVIGNHLSYACTRLAHHFNLTGPVVALDTACSSALLSVHMACKSLLNYECDLAIAGGVQLNMPQFSGYVYEEGGFRAPNGQCKTFDADAQGTVFGSGVGLVGLRRLEDALEEGDNIIALIRGSAVNNDGGDKVGYTAPSVSGQRTVVEKALAFADIDASSISYVEAHGTGTPLGDPIELRALSDAYAHFSDAKQYCAIGSLKPAFSHMETAAGVAGLIKTALMLQHKTLPGVVNYHTPNRKIDFENTPFYVNTKTRPWPDSDEPRRAAVSAFGIGGTNAHVILEEFNAEHYRDVLADNEESSRELFTHRLPEAGQCVQRPYMLMLSAQSPAALQGLVDNTSNMIASLSDAELASFSYHLVHSTPTYPQRFCAVATDREGLAQALSEKSVQQHATPCDEHKAPQVVFMFPGQGCQYVEMGKQLYSTEPVFQQQLDICLELISGVTTEAIKAILFPQNEGEVANAQERLSRTEVVQPLVFALEYALAQLWMSKGVKPTAFIGHSLGEYVAACLAGVFSLKDAIALICRRGRLMQSAGEGRMTGVACQKPELIKALEHVNEQLQSQAPNEAILCEISAENADAIQVVSGCPHGIAVLEQHLESLGIHFARLNTQHAYHSSMMDDAADAFLAAFDGIRLNKPTIPFVSCVTGDWIADTDATSVEYWSKQIRHKVEFVNGLSTVTQSGDALLLEVGPGQQLKSLVVHQLKDSCSVICSLPAETQKHKTVETFSTALGRLWQRGIWLDWSELFGTETRPRLPLPAYAFDRQSYWVFPEQASAFASDNNEMVQPTLASVVTPLRDEASMPSDSQSTALSSQTDVATDVIANWFVGIGWTMESLRNTVTHRFDDSSFVNCLSNPVFIVFDDGSTQSRTCIEHLQPLGPVTIVTSAEQFSQLAPHTFGLPSGNFEQLQQLFKVLKNQWHSSLKKLKHRSLYIVNFWPSALDVSLDCKLFEPSAFDKQLSLALLDPLNLAKACAELPMQQVRYCAVSRAANSVTGHEAVSPFAAMLETACKVISKEFQDWDFALVDIDEASSAQLQSVIASLFAGDFVDRKAAQTPTDRVVVIRNNRRCKPNFKAETFEARKDTYFGVETPVLQQGGIYVITGGLGGIGFELASHLAKQYLATLILVGRTAIPARERWQEWFEPGAKSVDQKTAQNIEKITALETSGARVIPVVADVADYASLKEGLQSIDTVRHCNGVFHCAGVSHSSAVLFTQQKDIDAVVAAKVKGAINLNRLFAEIDLHKPLDLIAYFSSLWSVVAEPGLLGYAAANRFLDALSWRMNHQKMTYCRQVLSINWSGWANVGMASHLFDDAMEGDNHKTSSIHPEQGIEALERVLVESSGSQVIIAPNATSILTDQPAPSEISSSMSTTAAQTASPAQTNSLTRSDYQSLKTVNSSTVTDQLTQIWKEVLGLESVDPDDNFFDIGGTSLLLSEALQKVKKRIDDKVKIIDLLNHPTVRSLSVFLAPIVPTENDLDEIAARANKRKASQKKRGRTDSLQISQE